MPQEFAQIAFQFLALHAAEFVEIFLAQPKFAAEVELSADVDRAIDAHERLAFQKIRPRPLALHALDAMGVDVGRERVALLVEKAQVPHVGRGHLVPGDESPAPMLAADEPGVGQPRQRLLHGAHAHPVLHGELFLGRQAMALAQCARFDGFDDGVGDALELGHAGTLRGCVRTG